MPLPGVYSSVYSRVCICMRRTCNIQNHGHLCHTKCQAVGLEFGKNCVVLRAPAIPSENMVGEAKAYRLAETRRASRRWTQPVLAKTKMAATTQVATVTRMQAAAKPPTLKSLPLVSVRLGARAERIRQAPASRGPSPSSVLNLSVSFPSRLLQVDGFWEGRLGVIDSYLRARRERRRQMDPDAVHALAFD